MPRQSPDPVSRRREWIRTAFRTAVFVMVCTGVSTVHSGCQNSPGQEETGPVQILLEEEGIGFAYLPDGCAQIDPESLPLELACELIETTETPAGPPGTIRLELGEPSDSYIELEDISALEVIREEQRPLFEALPGGEFLGVGGQIFYGPFGPSRYARGRFQSEDGATLQRIRLFMVHPLENRLVTFVYDHPAVDNADSAARFNNHLLFLLESLRTSDELLAEAADSAAADDPATN